jgi:hypothetical protein
MIGQFVDLTGRLVNAFYPGVGDVGIKGTVVATVVGGGGIVRADSDQSVPNSQWALAPTSIGCDPVNVGNPLVLQFDTGSFCVGQRVSFAVIEAEFAPVATNVTEI